MNTRRHLLPMWGLRLLCSHYVRHRFTFPAIFPVGYPARALGLFAVGWIWRHQQLGIWFCHTPANWPLFLLLLVMLPISLWAAPTTFREQYSIPRLYSALGLLSIYDSYHIQQPLSRVAVAECGRLHSAWEYWSR